MAGYHNQSLEPIQLDRMMTLSDLKTSAVEYQAGDSTTDASFGFNSLPPNLYSHTYDNRLIPHQTD